MTDSPAANSDVPYVGQRISLISKSAIRYVGTLYTIDTKASTVALKDVRSYGTEGRHRDGGPVDPSNRVYTFIVFRGPDITDLQFLPKDSDVPLAPHHPTQQRRTHPSDPQTVNSPHGHASHAPVPNQYNHGKAPDTIPHQHRSVDMKQNNPQLAHQSKLPIVEPPKHSPRHPPHPIQQGSPSKNMQPSKQPLYPKPPQPGSQHQPHEIPQPQKHQQPQPSPAQQVQKLQPPQQRKPGNDILHQKPIVRGPTPRAWGPPPVPPKQVRQAHVDRQPMDASLQRSLVTDANAVFNGNGNIGGHGSVGNGVPDGNNVVDKKAVHRNPVLPEGGENIVFNGGAVGGSRDPIIVPSNHVRETGSVDGVNRAAPAIGSDVVPPIAGDMNINGMNGGVAVAPQIVHMNGDRGYRGGRGRGRGRGYGGRFAGGSWRRGPGIKIPDEDFDFASMQEKFEAATIGPGGKRGEEEALGHIEVCYDKSRSFFDDLVPEKEMRSERVNAAQRRATDFETFGETGPGYHRSGYRSGRGRRGRGRGRGRGGRHGGGHVNMNGVVGGAPRQDIR